MKNTVLLLLLGSIVNTGDQFNGMGVTALEQQTNIAADQKNKQTEQAVALNKVEGKSLAEALSKTDIDMSAFEGLLEKEKSKTKAKGSDEEEEEEEEESSDKSSSDKSSDDKDKEDSDKSSSDEKKDSSSEKKDDDDQPEDKRLNGRDKNGMYKNHKNYVNLRNKINEQENGHQEMFDSINEKLSDRNFIQSAIDTGNKASGPFGRHNSPFERFRVRQESKKSSSSFSSSSSSTTTTSSSSSSSSSSWGWGGKSSSSSSFSSSTGGGDEEIDTPSHANPAPSTDPPDLFKSEFDDDFGEADGNVDDEAEFPPDGGNGPGGEGPEGGEKKDGAGKGKGGKGKGKGGKKPNPKGLHKKPGSGTTGHHGKPGLSGGHGTGQKPSFDFGPPKKPSDPPKDIMTPKEETCYSNRYSDLGDMTPIDHYLQTGQEQGRQYQCGNFMTWIMAGRYLDRYWEIGDKFGRNGRASVKMAKEHWHNNGTSQSPKLSMAPNYPEEEAYKCADENDACACEGRVHMGLRMRADNGEEIESFQGLLEFARLTTKTSGKNEAIVCRLSDFNRNRGKSREDILGDFIDLPKQCFCEPINKYEPYHCSGDGGQCSCKKGNVFYGAKYKSGNSSKIANFEEMKAQSMAVVAANNTDYVACDPSSFEGVDPLPDQEKECYCDDQSKADEDLVKNTIEYWRGKAAEKAAREAQAKADAEAEAAEAAEDAEHARLEAELKRTQAAKKAQEAALKKKAEIQKKALEEKIKAMKEAAEAAKKEAEEQAKKDAEEEAEKKAEYEKALQEAADKAKAAEKEKLIEQKRKLREEAEKAKAKAIKAEVAAALARQKQEHDRLVAEKEAKEEEERIAREKAEAEADRLEEEAREKAEAEEEAKRKEEQLKAAAAHAAELAQQKEQAKAALEKALAEALEKQQAAYEAKMAAAEKERKRKQKEKEEEEARQLAKKMAAEAAAEEARKKAEEEELRLKAEAEAAEAALKAQQKAEEEEKRRLEKEAHQKAMQELKAKDELLRAQRLEELAKTEAEVQAAQDEARKAQEALEAAEKERRRTLEAKAALEEEIQQQESKAALAKEKAAQAAADMEEAQKKAANWKKQAEAAKKKAAKEMADAEAAQKKREEELEAARAASEKKHAAALKKQQETYRKAQEAAEKAHKAAEEERKAKEAEQIAAHKKAMADRRAKFEKKFRNVWSTGPTGVSYLQMTTHDDPGELVAKMFKDTMIADEWNYHQVKRSWSPKGKLTYDGDRHHVTIVTSDDRVAEVIEETAAYYKDQQIKEGVPFDLVVIPLMSGSKDYIDWVKLQTLKKEDSAAFFNDEASAAITPLTKKVDEKNLLQSQVEETKTNDSSSSLWSSDPEDDEDEE